MKHKLTIVEWITIGFIGFLVLCFVGLAWLVWHYAPIVIEWIAQV